MRIYAKLEGQNPGGSSKDRIALKMIELAEKDGVLAAGRHDPRAVVGQHRHRPRARRQAARLPAARRDAGERVASSAASCSRSSAPRSRCQPGRGGQQRRDPAWREKIAADEPGYVFLFQYGNPANPLAHYEGTGPEIWRDCPEVDVFVAGLGTSGTLMGVGRYLKEQKPEVQVVAVEPPAGELVQGLRNLDDGFVPPIFEPDVLDRKLIVRPRESIEWTRRLLDECGVFAGISSGAAVAGAAKVAAHDGRGHDRHAAARRRVEVPLVRRVDRRPRRRRGTRARASTTGDGRTPRRRARAVDGPARRRAGRVPDRDGLRARRRRGERATRCAACSR